MNSEFAGLNENNHGSSQINSEGSPLSLDSVAATETTNGGRKGTKKLSPLAPAFSPVILCGGIVDCADSAPNVVDSESSDVFSGNNMTAVATGEATAFAPNVVKEEHSAQGDGYCHGYYRVGYGPEQHQFASVGLQPYYPEQYYNPYQTATGHNLAVPVPISSQQLAYAKEQVVGIRRWGRAKGPAESDWAKNLSPEALIRLEQELKVPGALRLIKADFVYLISYNRDFLRHRGDRRSVYRVPAIQRWNGNVEFDRERAMLVPESAIMEDPSSDYRVKRTVFFGIPVDPEEFCHSQNIPLEAQQLLRFDRYSLLTFENVNAANGFLRSVPQTLRSCVRSSMLGNGDSHRRYSENKVHLEFFFSNMPDWAMRYSIVSEILYRYYGFETLEDYSHRDDYAFADVIPEDLQRFVECFFLKHGFTEFVFPPSKEQTCGEKCAAIPSILVRHSMKDSSRLGFPKNYFYQVINTEKTKPARFQRINKPSEAVSSERQFVPLTSQPIHQSPLYDQSAFAHQAQSSSPNYPPPCFPSFQPSPYQPPFSSLPYRETVPGFPASPYQPTVPNFPSTPDQPPPAYSQASTYQPAFPTYSQSLNYVPYQQADIYAQAPYYHAQAQFYDGTYAQAPYYDGIYAQAPFYDGIYPQVPRYYETSAEAPPNQVTYGQTPPDQSTFTDSQTSPDQSAFTDVQTPPTNSHPVSDDYVPSPPPPLPTCPPQPVLIYVPKAETSLSQDIDDVNQMDTNK